MERTNESEKDQNLTRIPRVLTGPWKTEKKEHEKKLGRLFNLVLIETD